MDPSHDRLSILPDARNVTENGFPNPSAGGSGIENPEGFTSKDTKPSKKGDKNKDKKKKKRKKDKKRIAHEGERSAFDTIAEFYQYNPPMLRKAHNHTTSSGTRPPATYDRHLDPNLILRHVKYAPFLAQDLANIAQSALESASLLPNLPPIAYPFPLPSHRTKVIPSTALVNEEGVADFYRITTASFCATVAATLELKYPVWDKGYLAWTRNTTKTQAKAKADGFLQLQLNFDDTSRDRISEEDVPLQQDLKKIPVHFPDIAVWEFKNLLAGDRAMMDAILRLSTSDEEFPWEGCEDADDCKYAHTAADGQQVIVGGPVGPDALHRNIETVQRNPVIATPESVLDTKHTHGCHILQQGWAEAVCSDATYIIIHSGNLEIICYRSRKEQTLYITDVIEVPTCKYGYGKLHTGLYIAALRDAKDRTLQLIANNATDAPEAPNRKTAKTTGAERRRQKLSKELQESLLKEACSRPVAVLRPSSKSRHKFSSFVSGVPYYRANCKIDKSAKPPAFEILLKPPFAPYISRGTISIDKSPFWGIEGFAGVVIVKSGHSEGDIVKLENEYNVYTALAKAKVSGIPKLIGLFRHTDKVNPNLTWVAMVLEDMGEPLTPDLENLTRPMLNSFLSTLSGMHAAGYLHGKIALRNLVCTSQPSESVAIVSLGSASVTDSVDAKIAEYKQLLLLLPSPTKHDANDEIPSDELYKDIIVRESKRLKQLESDPEGSS